MKRIPWIFFFIGVYGGFIQAGVGFFLLGGLVLGVGVLSLVSSILPQNDFFQNPEVDFTVAMVSTIVLIVAGTLAGLMPALRASRIRPVVALRDE